MVWVIGSIKTSNPQFKALRWHLLLSYLSVMMTILGMSAFTVYEFFSHSLYQQLDEHLMSVAQTAIPTLSVVKHEYDEHQRKRDDDHEKEDNKHEPKQDHEQQKKDHDSETQIHEAILQHSPEIINPELNMTVVESLRKMSTHGMEWFDDRGNLMIKQGHLFPHWSFPEKRPITDVKKVQSQQIRSLILPVYNANQIEGYIRVNESTQAIESTLKKMKFGLGFGGILALGLTAIGGMWLTQQSLKPIEKNFQQLKQFTADASHELRSPLTVIKTSIDVMKTHPERIHSADEKKINAIASATQQMSQLVEDLLLLTRMDAENITLPQNRTVIPLEEILEDLLELWELEAQEKGIDLQGNLCDNIAVMGDGNQLTRLFSNLIANAIQYTPKGGQVTVSSLRQNRFVIVNVTDTGIGMTPEECYLVFNRFWRADQARNYREGGLGMGLAICYSIVQNHQGEITVNSRVGVGSSFQIRLPLSTG